FCLEKRGYQVLVGDEGVMPARRHDGLEVVPDGLPPVHKNARHLKFVKHAEWDEFCFDRREELVAYVREFLAVPQLCEIMLGNMPPRFERRVMVGNRLLQCRIVLERRFDRLFVKCWMKCKVAFPVGLEHGRWCEAKLCKGRFACVDFGLWDAADEV